MGSLTDEHKQWLTGLAGILGAAVHEGLAAAGAGVAPHANSQRAAASPAGGVAAAAKNASPAKAGKGEVELGGAGFEMTIGVVTGPRLTELWPLMSQDGSQMDRSNNKGLGAQLNRQGGGLAREFVTVEAKRVAAYHKLDAAYILRDKAKAEVARMQKAGTGKGNPIGARAKGGARSQVDKEVQGYLDELKEVEAALPDVKAAWADMFAASAAVSAATSEKQVHRQQGVVREQGKQIAEEKERIETMKKRMNGLIGIGIKIVSPGEWAEVAGEAAKFVGEQLVDQIPTDRLKQLEADLKTAQTALDGLEDDVDTAHMEQVGQLLQAANERLSKAKILMSKHVNSLRNSQQGAVEVLADNRDTASAARMIQDRTRMIQTLGDLNVSMAGYLQSGKTLAAQVHDVLGLYRSYSKLVTRPDSGIPVDGEYAKSLISTAAKNADALDNWISYLLDFEKSAGTVIRDVADQGPDGFMAPFDQFKDLLQDSLVNR